jgi:putative DNA primase/helicase
MELVSVFPSDIREAANRYLARDLPLVPIKPVNGRPSKRPTTNGWQHHPLQDTSCLAENWNIGLLLTVLTDIDTDLSGLGALANRRLPPTSFSWGRRGKPYSHYVYNIPGNKNKKFSAPPQKLGEENLTIIEIRHGKQQSVLPPSVHPSLERYEPNNGYDLTPAVWNAEECLVVVSEIAAIGLLSLYWKEGIRNEAALHLAGAMAHSGWELPRAEKFFTDLGGLARDDTSRLSEVRRTYEKFHKNEPITGVEELTGLLGETVVTGRLVKWLQLSAKAEAYREMVVAILAEAKPRNLLAPLQNDSGNAERLLQVHGDNLLYCTPWKKWLGWDGQRWLLDEKEKIRSLARDAMQRYITEAARADKDEHVKFGIVSKNSGSISSAIREAQDQRAVLPGELDSHPHLLNFLNGTLDLRTLELRSHDRKLLLTKLVHCNWNPTAQCPELLTFLVRVVGKEQLRLLMRALGYTMTGEAYQKCAFPCVGETDTGKTTLLGFFREYSTLIMATSLMAHSYQDANTLSDLADLCGARFAHTSELKEGMVIDEALMKRLAPGRGMIRGVRKYELPFSFPATHKLWIDNNHAIVMRATGDDVWGRIIPFTFGPRIPKNEIDHGLPDTLRKEMEGFYALVCKASKRWYAEGLGELPEQAVAKREEWRSNADRVRRFLDECCVPDIDAKTAPRELYQGYNLWDREGGERPMTETMFFLKLKELGFRKDGRCYAAIRLSGEWRIHMDAVQYGKARG